MKEKRYLSEEEWAEATSRAKAKRSRKMVAPTQPAKKVTTIMGSNVKPLVVVWLWPDWWRTGNCTSSQDGRAH